MAIIPSITQQLVAENNAKLTSERASARTPTKAGTLLEANKTVSDWQKSGNYGLHSKASPTNTGGTTNQNSVANPQAIAGGVAGGGQENLQRTLVGSKSFVSKSGGSGVAIGGSSGAISNDGTAIPSAYLIKVSSQDLGHTVTAVLQQEVSLRTSSEWETFIPFGDIASNVNSLVQLAVKTSLQTRLTTRRIWKGTSPIEISLTFKFESIDNTYRNVVLPCEALMMMASPYSLPGPLPFLAPPGPSPFKTTSAFVSKQIQEHIGKGDNTNIRLGDFLEFNSVIIKDVNPVFSARMDVNGLPISATCTIVFQSYEIMTRSAIQKAFINKAG